MKYIKEFKDLSIKEPFYLSETDKLYISDDMCKSILPNRDEKTKYEMYFIFDNNAKFYNDTRDENGIRKYSDAYTTKTVKYGGMFIMKIRIGRLGKKYAKNIPNFGLADFYITGESGDNRMHAKNRIRTTRECNLNFIALYYPVVKYIKNFYTEFKKGDRGFIQIIRDEIDKDINLARYGIPDELRHIYGDLDKVMLDSEKYNL
jgi:hypothetical protein